MNWEPIISAAVGAVLMYLGQIVVARYSKTKQQRDVELARDYFDLSKATVDELEAKINRISQLEKDMGGLERENRQLHSDIDDLNRKRAHRDEQLEAMGAQIAALTKQIQKDTVETGVLRDEVRALRQQVAETEAKYARAKTAIEKLLEWMKSKGYDLPSDIDLGDSIAKLKWPK